MSGQAAAVGRRVREAGVAWRDCEGCGLPWPFPRGAEEPARDWRCARCLHAAYAAAMRELRASSGVAPEEG